MAIYEFECVECGKRNEQRLPSFPIDAKFCSCGGQLQLVPSVPAAVRVGKYGKAGGLKGE